MRIAIVGSRNFNDYEVLKTALESLKKKATLIVSGGAKGADSLGERWAKENNIETLIFLPDWEKYRKAAGFIRNQEIVLNCDVCVAFWDGQSKGTLSTIELCKKAGKEVVVVLFTPVIIDKDSILQKMKNLRRI